MLLPEEQAREKIDKQLKKAGWDIVARDEYVPKSTSAVKEALMKGNTESDYLLFVDNKAIAVVEAKREENPLDAAVEKQAEGYAVNPQDWYGTWKDGLIPLVYLANGNKIYFKNMLDPDGEYEELTEMHSPKKMLKLIGESSEYGALPRIEKKGLRDCQYNAEVQFEESLKAGKKKALAVLATGSGKTYLACLASYRLLNYTQVKRVLFLVDRNNLARQTESEYSVFDRTEGRDPMSSLYQIKRLKKEADVNGDIVISTIQKLYAVLTGGELLEENEDAEDEILSEADQFDDGVPVALMDNLKLESNHFDLIIVDECHRSIYGKWKAVLDYFSDAKVLGLTATPTPEAYSFFDENIIENYTYDDSVVDGVNVPSRTYRIRTRITEQGGKIEAGDEVDEINKRTGETTSFTPDESAGYETEALDRSIINRNQIREVLKAYREAIYSELYPDREEAWEFIPKTLIFAKNDSHATEIVEMAKEVFGEMFPEGSTPEGYVQKITYSSGDSNELIRMFRTEKEFRIAVTVTLVSTGTDIRPLEVVLFMKDVQSDVLYTQMKGRGCRIIGDDKLKEVTPNAETKECYYIVDAVGVTEHEKYIPGPGAGRNGRQRTLTLTEVLEHIAHADVGDENLLLLRDYCASIHHRYEDNPIFGRHLEMFISDYGFSPRYLADKINKAFERDELPPFVSPSEDNSIRMNLVDMLISNIDARKKLIEMRSGYLVAAEDKDELLYAGFSKETARTFTENFEKYMSENKDSIEALRIIYNSENTAITHSMLIELRDKLLAENKEYNVAQIWTNYKTLDETGAVEEYDNQLNAGALTNLIQIAKYVYKKSPKLISIMKGYSQGFTLYCGQNQRVLSEDQVNIMRQVADYVIKEGSITTEELNTVNTDLWRRAVNSFGAIGLKGEMNSLTKFILKVA